MCDPLSIAGAALGFGGTLLNARNARRQQSDLNAATAAERARQTGFANRAGGSFDEALEGQGRDNQDEKIDDVKGTRTVNIQGNVTRANDFIPSSGSAPRVVTSEVARGISDALRAGQDRAKQFANVGAFGDVQVGNRADLNRTAQDISVQGSFARGSADILPIELQTIRNRKRSPIGDILSGVGQLAGFAGLAGIGPSFGDIGNLFRAAPRVGGGGGANIRLAV